MVSLVALPFVSPGTADAACNLIPVAKRTYPSTLGGVSSPITAPGKTVEIEVGRCDTSAGFEPVASANAVTLRFEPPGSGVDTNIVIASGTVSVSGCDLPSGRCRILTFVTPDTLASAPPAGLAGPARVIVRDGFATVVAEIGELFLPTTGCDRQPETVFEQLVVLPPPNNFADAVAGTATELLATIDGGGNLLVPFDYWGGGTSSVLAENPGAPVAIFLEGTATIPAMNASDPNTIADALAAQTTPSDFVRSFTLVGRPLPPLLRVTTSGGLFGTADAAESVLRIARNDGHGGPVFFDVSDRLSATGRGPIVIDTFSVARKNPAPLNSIHSSPGMIAYVRDEAREDDDLNGDTDKTDRVAQIVAADTGTPTNTGRAVTETIYDLTADRPYELYGELAFPAVGVDEGFVAFLESESEQFGLDQNGDADQDDNILRVFDRDGVERTAALAIEAAPDPLIDGKPVAVSGDKVFFRAPSTFVESTAGLPSLGGASHVTLSPDEAYVYVSGRTADSVTVFSRNPSTGQLTYVETQTNGVGGVNGLDGAAASIMSPDGKHLYVVGEAENAFSVFSRDSGTGVLTFVEAKHDGVGGVDGLGGASWVSMSPDGAHLYVTGSDDQAIAVFARNSTTGALTFVEAESGHVLSGWSDPATATVTPDGKHVYVATTAPTPDSSSAFHVFSRDSLTGALTPIAGGNANGDMYAPAVSPDGKYVYRALWVGLSGPFIRNPVTGALMLWGFGSDPARPLAGFGSIPWTDSLTLSADGTRLYSWCRGRRGAHPHTACEAFGYPATKGRITVWRRNLESGQLTDAQIIVDSVAGVHGLGNVQSLVVTSDGRDMYVASDAEDAVTLIRNDVALHVFDATAQTVLAPQPIASLASVAGERAVFLTPERVAGADLNVDGDFDDDVAQLYDASGGSPVVVNLGVAASRAAISSQIVALVVPEADEPSADNGDADRHDSVLAIYEIGSLTPVTMTSHVADSVAVSGTRVVFAAPEFSNGDFNGDGLLIDDRDLCIYDYVMGGGGTLTSLAQTAEDFVVDGSLVAFTTSEIREGGVDLDGDGNDDPVGDYSAVLQVLDLDTGKLTNTGIAATRCSWWLGCEPSKPYRVDGTRGTVSFLAWELEQSRDLDGDGDANDQVLVVYQARAGRAQTVSKTLSVFPDGALPVFEESFVDGFVMYAAVVESEVGEDLDGDGAITGATAVVLVANSDDDGAIDDFDTCVEQDDPTQADRDVDELGDAACDPRPPLCPAIPRNGCKGMIEPGRSTLSIKNKTGVKNDSLVWKWKKGDDTAVGAFGDPIDELPLYTVCVYDASAEEQPLVNAVALPRGTCEGVACWSEKPNGAFRLDDRGGAPSGIQKMSLKPGSGGKAAVSVKAKGGSLETPALPLTLPVKVQLVVDDGGNESCFEATYGTTKKSDATTFSARSD